MFVDDDQYNEATLPPPTIVLTRIEALVQEKQMTEHDDRRHNTRVAFHATVDLDFAGRKFSGCETENLSTKGVLVLGITDRALGDSCDIALHLSGTSHDISLTMLGEVVRLEDNGIGIRFTEIDLDSYTHLRNIIYYNSADPDSLEEFPFNNE